MALDQLLTEHQRRLLKGAFGFQPGNWRDNLNGTKRSGVLAMPLSMTELPLLLLSTPNILPTGGKKKRYNQVCPDRR